MKEETPYVTLVDAGDAIQGAPVGTLSEGEYLVQIMNKAGYDFAVPEIMNSTTGWKSSWDFPPDWTAAILPATL